MIMSRPFTSHNANVQNHDFVIHVKRFTKLKSEC